MSERVVRESAQAISKMQGILGVHWMVFVAISAICFFILQYISLNAGLFLWMVSIAGVKTITKKDPRILKILWIAIRFKPIYDPFNREPFTLVIVEDE
jgi:type IV secretory pathway TrbD component